MQLSKAQNVERQLLLLVLPFVRMKDGEVTELSLFNFLEKFGITGDCHEHFGEYRKTISDKFIHQMYLKQNVVKVDDKKHTEK